MAIAERDTRLKKALKETRGEIAAFGFEDEPKVWADQALGLLDRRYVMFAAAVENEDNEEVELTEAQAEVSEARVELNVGFENMWNGYQLRLSELKLAGQFDTKAMNLREYLSELTPSEFRSVDIERAVSTVKRGRRFGAKFLPQNYRDEITQRVDAAITRIDAAREAERAEAGEANSAYASLSAARQKAQDGYLSARDLLKAALRESGQLDRLDTLMPSLTVVLRGAQTTDEEEDPTPVA